jgi:urease accessory protein
VVPTVLVRVLPARGRSGEKLDAERGSFAHARSVERMEHDNVRDRRGHFTRLFAVAGIAVAAIALGASPAGAHTGGPVHGLTDGALHPLTGLDHLLAMIAVGAIAALGTWRRRPWAVVAAFLGAMVAGGMLGLAGIELPGVETAIVMSVIGLGLAVALAPRTDAAWVLALVAAAGLVHGTAHGAEAPTAANPLLYVLGFVAVTAGLHALGACGGVAVRRAPALRVAAGVGLAASGALLLFG